MPMNTPCICECAVAAWAKITPAVKCMQYFRMNI